MTIFIETREMYKLEICNETKLLKKDHEVSIKLTYEQK